MISEEYHEFECTACSVKVIVKSIYNKNCCENDGVRCPICKRYLGEVMADTDTGYEILGTKALD